MTLQDFWVAIKAMASQVYSLLKFVIKILVTIFVALFVTGGVTLFLTTFPVLSLTLFGAFILISWFIIELKTARVIREYEELKELNKVGKNDN